MAYVIRCKGMAGMTLRPGHPSGAPVGQFLESYDPEAHDGYGDAVFTTDLRDAMQFETQKAAWDCWVQVPKSRPYRPDRKPNRPLTAFSIEIEESP